MKPGGTDPRDAILMKALETYDASIMIYPTRYPPASSWTKFAEPTLLRSEWEAALAEHPVAGLYVNIPFCRSACRFCYLPTRVPEESREVDCYLDALEAESETWSRTFKDVRFSALYIGGGTPSLLTERQIRRLFEGLRSRFSFDIQPPYQAAFEGSPESMTEGKVRLLASLGVTWMSFGIQSFDPAVLARAGRRPYRAEEVERLVAQARSAGIRGIGLDLMCGLEGQAEEGFLRDIRTVCAWQPDQIFLNTFRPLKETPFAAAGGRLDAAACARRDRMWAAGFAEATRLGYVMIGNYLVHENVSALGRTPWSANLLGLCPFFRSASVLGLGSAAISYVYRRRWYRNAPGAAAYAERARRGDLPIETDCPTGKRREMINFAVERLELEGRIPAAAFRDAFGESLDAALGGPVSELLSRRVLRPTPEGYGLAADYGASVFAIARAFFEWPVVVRMALAHERYEVAEDD